MTKSSSRCGRLGDLLHRELSKLIRTELSLANIGMVTISGVVVSEDLSFARVYVTVLQDDKKDSSMQALHNSEITFRMLLSKTLKLRMVPKIKFFYDDSVNIGSRMDRLLNSVKDPNQNESEY